MDITEQEAERIFKFIVKKLGYEDAYVKPIDNSLIDNSMCLTNDILLLTAVKKDLTYSIVGFINDSSIGRITGNSWTDMLEKVIQYSIKSFCYICAESVLNKFKMPKTLEELRIMIDLES